MSDKSIQIRQSTEIVEKITFDGIYKQLQMMIVNGKRYTKDELQALASFSAMTQLNPCNNECALLKGANGEILGPFVQYPGWLKTARRQLWQIRPDDDFTTNYRTLQQNEIPTDLANNDEIIYGYECQVRIKSQIDAYISQAERLSKLGLSGEDLQNAIGKPPVWYGQGFFKKSEYSPKKDAKYHPSQRAKKRALVAALRIAFNIDNKYKYIDDMGLQQEGVSIVGPEDADIIEGEAFESPITEPTEERPYPPEITKQRLLEFAKDYALKGTEAGNNILVATIGNLERCFEGEDRVDEIRHGIAKWVFGTASFKDIEDHNLLALHKWMHAKPGENNKWQPDPLSRQEARAIWDYILKDQGQQELFSNVDTVTGEIMDEPDVGD